MSTIILRSALVHWGRKPAPDLAYVVSDRPGKYRVVTWAEVMEARRKRQEEQLRRKREWFVYPWRAYKLWVAYFDQDFFGGWQAMMEDWRGRGYDIWIDRDCTRLEPMLIKVFPLVVPLGAERDQWERWKPAFAARFERRRQDRHPLGVAYVWWNGRDVPRIDRGEVQEQ
jgi:hypothetical protein